MPGQVDWLLILILFTSIWVLVDAKVIGVKKGQIEGFFNMGPAGWFFSCLLLWIVAFPAYIAKRGQYKAAIEVAPGPPVDNHVREIRKLADLRDEGILTDEEFAAKKRQLLGL